MTSKNFVVHNGLEVGSTIIFAGNGDMVTSGNITRTSISSISTTYVQKLGLQFPTSLAGPTWYKIGNFSVETGPGSGETIQLDLVAGQGYASDSSVHDIAVVRFKNGASPNIESNYYSLGYREGILGIKLKSVNNTGTDTTWDVYAYLNSDLGHGYVEIKLTPDGKFTWINTVDSDPGTASATLVVATNKFVTASANVVVKTGDLYVGGNIYQQGSQVSTTAASGLLTKIIQGNDTVGPYNLGSTPADKDQVTVWWNGIYQPRDTYSVAGTNITFTEPIPLGSNAEVKILAGSGVSALGTLADIDFTSAPGDGQFLQYDALANKWRANSSTSISVVQNTALVYAVALGGF